MAIRFDSLNQSEFNDLGAYLKICFAPPPPLPLLFILFSFSLFFSFSFLFFFDELTNVDGLGENCFPYFALRKDE